MVVACVQVPNTPKTNKSQLAVSSVRDVPTSYQQGSTFALSPKYLEKVSLNPEQQENAYQMYGDAIINSLQAQGYQVATGSDTPDFLVGYGVALSEDLSDERINEIFGVTPGLHNAHAISKGSFLVYIKDVSSDQKVWRGAVQGFVQDELSAEQRLVKAKTIVNSVLIQFYKQK